MTIPTFAQSIEMHAVLMKADIATVKGNELTTKAVNVLATKTLNDCYAALYDLLWSTADVTQPDIKALLFRYEDVLKLIKFLNKPGKVAEADREQKYTELYKLAYDNFAKVNL